MTIGRLAVLCFAIWPAGSASLPTREVTYDTGCGQTFDKGYVLGFSGARLSVCGPDGHRAFDVALPAPDDSAGRVQAAAVDRDGRVAAILWYGPTPHPTRSAMILLGASGKVEGSIDLGEFFANAVSFAPDRSIWMTGSESRNGRERKNYSIVRRFSAAGKPDGEFLSRSLFGAGVPIPAYTSSVFPSIQFAAERVGILLYNGWTDRQPEWVELDFSGKLLGRWQLPQARFLQLAFTRDGQLYSNVAANHPGQSSRLDRWDRTSSSWKTVREGVGLGSLVGAQGEHLVFLADGAPRNRLIWVPVN